MKRFMGALTMAMLSFCLCADGVFTVTQYNLKTCIETLDGIEYAIYRPGSRVERQATKTYSQLAFVSGDVQSQGEPHFYGSMVHIPLSRGSSGCFAVKVDGIITIPESGYWTFAFGSDDGFRAEISGHGVLEKSSSVDLRTFETTLHKVLFENPGKYNFRLIWFTRGYDNAPGDLAGLEVSIAQGSYSSFNASAFKLLKASSEGLSYEVRFDANGGYDYNEMNAQIYEESKEQKLSKNTYHKEGYVFQGWATNSIDRANSGIVDFVDEQEITVDSDLTLYAVWEANQVVIHFNANGGVFKNRKTGEKVDKFDQCFVYGVPQKLFTDDLVPLKPDENGNQFLGWVRGTPNIYPDSDIVAGRKEETFYSYDGTETTYYAVWSSTVMVVFSNNGDELVPASLADHLKWVDVNDPNTWYRSGDSVQMPPGRHVLLLYCDAAYAWIAGEFQIDSSHAQYYNPETLRLTLDISNDYRDKLVNGSTPSESGKTVYVNVGPKTQGQKCGVLFKCAGETVSGQTFAEGDVNITLTYKGPSGEVRPAVLPGFSAGRRYDLPYGVYEVDGKSRDGKWVAPPIRSLVLAGNKRDVYLSFHYQPGNYLSGCKITLNPCGGTVDPTEIYVYAHDGSMEVPLLPMPEHTWREFRGWWTQENGKGRKVVPGTTFYGSEVGNKTLYAHWETIMQRFWDKISSFAVKTSTIDGTTVVTLTSDVSGTIEIPDNISALTIDLNGHNMTGDDSAAIRIVTGDGEGAATRLVIVDSSEGEKGQIAGVGESAGIEVAEGAAFGVSVAVADGVGVFNGDGSEQEIKPMLVGTGKVTVPKTWKVGQKVTWKAVADKGSVFARWEGPLVDSLNLTKNERRNPSLAFGVPEGFDTNQVTAAFIRIDDDGFSSLGITQTVFSPNVALSEVYVVDDSRSYVTASVKGLPSGLKYDAKTMAISGKATKPGVYKVTVSATNATVKKPVAAEFEIVVPNLSSEAMPGLEQGTDAYGVVTCGVAFDPGLVDCSPEDGWTLKAAGLPAGLKLVQDKNTKAYSITGIPTKAGTYTVTFTASKKGEKNQIATITLNVEAAPEWAIGTFSGCVAGTGNWESGTASMTVTANGKISGKIAIGGTNWTFKADSYSTVGCRPSNVVDGAVETNFVVNAVATAGKAKREIELRVAESGAVARDARPYLVNAKAKGASGDGEWSLALWRGMWKDKATAAAAKTEIAKWVGVYTLSLAPGADYGSGYLSLTIGKDGNVKTTGKLADGTSVSATSPLMYDEDAGWFVYLYAAPSAYKGGCFAVAVGFDTEGGARTTWRLCPVMFTPLWSSKNPQATGEYGEGFEREIDMVGAYYDKLDTLRKYYESLRLSLDGAPELGYVFKETYLNDLGRKTTAYESMVADAVDMLWQEGLTATVNEKGAIVVAKVTKPVQDKTTKAWSYNGANDGALTLSFTLATGIFKGSYTFWYDYMSAYDETTEKETWAHTSKKVNFEGILVHGEKPTMDGLVHGEEPTMDGFYLWDATGEYEDAKTGKPRTYKYKRSFPVSLKP